MIGRHRVLGLIPARGGSKGIPQKNIRSLGGKPLIAWTIDEARKSEYIDRLIVSTDDQEIASVANKHGADVPFLRPAALATDNSRGIDVVLHALKQLPNYFVVVLLQPTSPFRTVEDIDSAIKIYNKHGESVVSVTEASQTPYWMYTIEKDQRIKNVIPKIPDIHNRQDLPKIYILNGMIYISDRTKITLHESFMGPQTRAYIVDTERSIDIDTENDWQQAERMLNYSA